MKNKESVARAIAYLRYNLNHSTEVARSYGFEPDHTPTTINQTSMIVNQVLDIIESTLGLQSEDDIQVHCTQLSFDFPELPNLDEPKPIDAPYSSF